jgi:hypothetical protein
VGAAVLLATSCADDDGGGSAATSTTAAPTTTTARPAGPVATVSGPLIGGGGVNLASPRVGPDLEAAGWVEEEYVVAGVATSYRADGRLPADGALELVEDASAAYRTRIVVRRPVAAADFHGTVVVEWFNVSGGLDAAPDWSYLADELVRSGSAWVGVSAQHLGVEGGPVAVAVEAGEGIAGRGLRDLDPERYRDLHHPGDAFAYDIYSQVGRVLREVGGGALGDLVPERLLAIGQSQSAFLLTTYANGVQPIAGVYDGFLLHGRPAAAAPLGEAGRGIDVTQIVAGEPTRVRTDLDAPVLTVETESDVVSVLGYHAARQPDTDRFRLWEIAGTAHADAYLVGDLAGLAGCPGSINAGPTHFVLQAALRGLDRWVRTGEAPPEAARLDVDSAGPVIRRDADGIALGGIRTPLVDVPADVLSGEPTDASSTICLLLGSTTPLPPERLAARHPSRAAYLAAFEAATDAAIAAGFVLPEDRAALLAEAQPDRLPG